MISCFVKNQNSKKENQQQQQQQQIIIIIMAKTAKLLMTPLPNDFIPGEYDVICAKGKAATQHNGNKFYRKLIQHALPIYKDATTKFEKSMIVSEIVDEIRSRSGSSINNVNGHGNGSSSGSVGGFVRRRSGIFYEAGDHFAREKVGQSLRDSLSDKYRSSTRAKKQRQNFVSAGVADQFDRMIKRNSFITRRINTLTTTAATSIENYQNIQLSDTDKQAADELDKIFSQTNLEILEAFKNNTDLVDKFAEVEYCHKTMA